MENSGSGKATEALRNQDTEVQEEKGTASPSTDSSNSKRKSKLPGVVTKKTTGGRGKSQVSGAELLLQAIQALTNLPENGQFFLVTSTEDEDKDIISHWN